MDMLRTNSSLNNTNEAITLKLVTIYHQDSISTYGASDPVGYNAVDPNYSGLHEHQRREDIPQVCFRWHQLFL